MKKCPWVRREGEEGEKRRRKDEEEGVRGGRRRNLYPFLSGYVIYIFKKIAECGAITELAYYKIPLISLGEVCSSFTETY